MAFSRLRKLWAARSEVTVDPGLPTDRVWLGYIPRASRTDALAYTAAWAEKYIEAPAAVGAYLHRYLDGYFFELQERGIGKKAWLPSILRVWDAQQERGEPEKIFLALDRTIEGTRNGDRIGFIVLPEGASQHSTTPGLAADGPSLGSLRPERDALASSVRLFLFAGILVLIGSLWLRVVFPPKTEVTQPAPTTSPISVIRLPIGQWPNLVAIARRGGYVTELQYQNSTWRIQQSMAEQTQSGAATTVSAKHSGPPLTAAQKPKSNPKPATPPRKVKKALE